MRAIFLIHLRQLIPDKDWVYPVVLLLLCTLLGQYLAPTDDDPTLVYSTRTQAIWLCAWGCQIRDRARLKRQSLRGLQLLLG
jgi:hypothetical protein